MQHINDNLNAGDFLDSKYFYDIQRITGRLKDSAFSNISMRKRLLVFLSMLVVIMMLGIVILLLTVGLPSAVGDAQMFIEQELSNITHHLTSQLGDASVQLVWLSNSLSRSIEYQLSSSQIQISELQSHPELLEEILENELSLLQLALEKTKCSGVFMVLDATVNPTLTYAGNSRAGLYIRNCEPAVVGSETGRLFLRGPSRIALRNNLSLQSKWDMEFDIQDKPYWDKPIGQYRETPLPLSRLYYWGFEGAIPDLAEDVVLCSIPLIDSDANVFGVCGFEISATNFKLNYMPDDKLYKNLVYTFSAMNELEPDICCGLFSGHNAMFCGEDSKGMLTSRKVSGKLNLYMKDDGTAFVGKHEVINLYPSGSAFARERFAAALIMPKEDLDAEVFKRNIQVALICAPLLILGFGISFYISKKYLNPIIYAFDAIQSGNPGIAVKTNMLEINRLIDQINALREKSGPLPDDLFDDFIARVRTLTRTEMELFRYYLEGRNSREILSLMYISANTLKSHNKHIYTKLNVSSKDELMLYIELIRKSGLMNKII